MKTKVIILLMALSGQVLAEDRHNIYVGFGLHSEKYDCPEVCYGGDTLAIIEYTYDHTKYTQFKALHISNPLVTERGYGTNAIFYGINIKF